MLTPTHRIPLAAAGLIVLSVGLNLAYLVWDCPLDLAPDEAHYWHWSRNPDWSYYSKGPLVAWLIRASCELFGELSVRLVGTEMLAVRLPAVASQAVLLAGLYVLAAGTLRSARAGLAVVPLALTLPPVNAAGVIMTIDPPFLACWCWALVGVRMAVGEGRTGCWLLAGVCSGIGILAKYPMLLFPLVVAGFLLAHRRDEFRRPGFWVFLALSLLGCLPILVWNAGRDWVSLRHVLGQAGIGGAKDPGFRWLGPLAFAAGQFGLLLGFWLAAFAAAAWRFRPSGPSPLAGEGGSRSELGEGNESKTVPSPPPLSRKGRGEKMNTGLSLLWWASVPVWGVFALASFRAAEQVNWPAAAYVGGLVLAVAWVREQLAHPSQGWRRLTAGCLGLAIAAGIGLSACAHYPGLVRPLLAAIGGPPTEGNPVPVRKLDPTCRLRGWRTLAHEVDAIRDRVRRETGQEPVLAGMLWTTPGELGFYCRDHPEAYSFGLALADRHSQYDLWRPNPVADAQVFRGRSFVYVGEPIPGADEVFDRVDPPIRVVHREDEIPVATWTIWVGHGFRGFGHPRWGAARAGY
jgi:4-amino-4-deoxy-L-arabinose transferase-like glycosyltransferase